MRAERLVEASESWYSLCDAEVHRAVLERRAVGERSAITLVFTSSIWSYRAEIGLVPLQRGKFNVTPVRRAGTVLPPHEPRRIRHQCQC